MCVGSDASTSTYTHILGGTTRLNDDVRRERREHPVDRQGDVLGEGAGDPAVDGC